MQLADFVQTVPLGRVCRTHENCVTKFEALLWLVYDVFRSLGRENPFSGVLAAA